MELEGSAVGQRWLGWADAKMMAQGGGPTPAGSSSEAGQAEWRARGGSRRSRSAGLQALPANRWEKRECGCKERKHGPAEYDKDPGINGAPLARLQGLHRSEALTLQNEGR